MPGARNLLPKIDYISAQWTNELYYCADELTDKMGKGPLLKHTLNM